MLLRSVALASLIAAGALPALAQTETVTFTLSASQPSLFNDDLRDTYRGVIDDRSGTTTFEVVCSAGQSGFLGLTRVDETCAVSGSGIIKNPNNPAQTLPRIGYAGGFTVEARQDGYTNAATILANYLRAGAAAASNESFGGHLIMMPENPSASASELRDRLLQSLRESSTGTQAVSFSNEIDSIRFNQFRIPHVGRESCTWTGDAIYAYANDSWQMQFDVTCGSETFRLEGNMPLVAAPAGAGHQEEYQLNLILPGAGGGDPFAAADPFATVDGVTAVFTMKNAGRSTEDEVYENVEVAATITGQGVPLELVRGFAQIMTLFGRTFFGA